MHHQPIPHPPSATESDTRAALAWAAGIGRTFSVLTAHAAEDLAWDGFRLASPCRPEGRVEVSLRREPGTITTIEVALALPGEMNFSALQVPALVFAAGD